MFTQGDLHIEHVFADGDEITGIVDWSEASQGDALYDIATLTLAYEEYPEVAVLRSLSSSSDRGRA